jgi:hypothetical protein
MWDSGQRVLATRLEDAYWYPGTVRQADAQRCRVLFDDGDERTLADDQLLPLQIDVGDRLFVRLPGGATWTPGRVLRLDGDKINIQFDDGGDEQTSLGMIRIDPTEWKDPGGALPVNRWIVGDRVLAKWSRDRYWYPGTIQAIRGGELHVYFEDGDHEWLPTDRVLQLDLRVGSRVYARTARGPVYAPGRIARRDGDRLWIDYDDGRQEATSVCLIRVALEPLDNPWRVGQRVLAQWQPEPFYYPGVVDQVNDEVVHIKYDDGDHAYLTPDLILPLRLKVGHRVYGRRDPERLYYPAVIERKDGDQLYLRYDDGNVEWSTVQRIRVLPMEITN